ncbi:MAG: hypothetical protein ACRDS0_17645 [Pseudonocardiaceae bacterium]
MGATEASWDLTPEVIRLCLDALVVALAQRGLAAELVGIMMVQARNSAVDPRGDALRASMSPGLRRMVICRPDDADRLSWFWVRSGPTRDTPSKLEYLGPAGRIGDAADRIASELRLTAQVWSPRRDSWPGSL